MTSFHQKRDFLVAVDEAVQWVGDAGRYQGISAAEINTVQETIMQRAETDDASVCGNVVYFNALLAFRYECWLNDDCMKAGLALIIGDRTNVKIVDSTILRLDANDRLAKLQFIRKMFDRNMGIIIIPYNINNNHWCLMIVNWDARSIIRFDPLQKLSVYGELSKLSRAFVAPLMSGE